MRTSLLAALAATCVIIGGCGGDSSTAPHANASLAGKWVGTASGLTITMDVGADTLCDRSYGYCNAIGTGTYALSDGASGSFALSVNYFVSGQLIVMNIGGFGTDANILFSGKFDSANQLSGMLYETSAELTPLHVGIDGYSITFVRQ